MDDETPLDELIRILRKNLDKLEGFSQGLPDGHQGRWLISRVDDMRGLINNYEQVEERM